MLSPRRYRHSRSVNPPDRAPQTKDPHLKKPAQPKPPPTVPLRTERDPVTWQGKLHRKPWHYTITAAIPCLDHARETAAVIELLRLQTCRPYIILVDTGSTPRELAKLEALRADDVELHLIRRNGMQHHCDAIAAALDLTFSLADTPYVYCTHQDCFARSRHLLQHLMDNIHGLAAIGYRLSPRAYAGWEAHFGHTCTLFSVAEWDRIGITWSLRRAASLIGQGRPANEAVTKYQIDTEAAVNVLLQRAAAKTSFIGTEGNFIRTKDDFIDHPRSVICTKLYFPDQYPGRRADCDLALAEAHERIRLWRSSGPADPHLTP